MSCDSNDTESVTKRALLASSPAEHMDLTTGTKWCNAQPQTSVVEERSQDIPSPVNMTETQTVHNQCDTGTLTNHEKERSNPTSTFSSVSYSATANNKRTHEDTDLSEDDEWDTFGKYVALVMRSVKCAVRRERMKIELLKILVQYRLQDDVYSEQFNLNNINKTYK